MIRHTLYWCLLISFASTLFAADEPEWKVGLASVNISPQKPIMLLGNPGRLGVFESVSADIFAKALAFEDRHGKQAVIITADLVGFQAAVTTEPVSARLKEKLGLEPSQLIFNASHTHTAPVVSLQPHLRENVGHPPMTASDAQNTIEYTRDLQNKLVELVETAIHRLEPARLSWGRGKVGFVMSRRLPTPDGVVMAANPNGLIDPAVPVLKVESPAGKLRAVVFGVACHNTTLMVNTLSGDYAGFAQAEVEQQHPGVQAMFMSGCGADANPNPMGRLDQAKAHGSELAQEVERIISGKLETVHGPLGIAYQKVELPVEQPSPEKLEAYIKLPNYQARQAQEMRRVMSNGISLPKNYSAPLSVWQFGDSLTLVALPAEPVAEYQQLIATALGPEKSWVAGFNNDCFGYLPTAKVVREGGHEAIGITLWAWGEDLVGRVGFFELGVQDAILNGVRNLADAANAKVKGAP